MHFFPIKGILSTAQAEGGKPCGNFPLKANMVRRFTKKSSQRQFAKTRKPVSLTQCTIKQIPQETTQSGALI